MIVMDSHSFTLRHIAEQNQRVVEMQIRESIKKHIVNGRILRAKLDHAWAVYRGERSPLEGINENQIACQTWHELNDLWDQITWRLAPGLPV